MSRLSRGLRKTVWRLNKKPAHKPWLKENTTQSMIPYRYWSQIIITAILYYNELPGKSNKHGQSRHKILWKRSGAFKTTKILISLIRSRNFHNWTLWFARSGQLPPVLERPDWPIQVDFPITPDQLKKFSTPFTYFEKSDWPVQSDPPIFFVQVDNFSHFKRFNWTVPSWLSRLLKLNWKCVSILSNIIVPIRWRSFTSLKHIHWIIVE